MFSGQDINVIREESSLEPPTNIIDTEQASIISEINNIIPLFEESFNDQNSVCNSSEMLDFSKTPF